MMKLLGLLVVIVAVSAHSIQKRAPAGGYKRVCYHTNWAQYRPNAAKFFPESIDPCLCTHVIYAFANLVGGKLKAFEWNDESTSWSKGMYERFHETVRRNKDVKTLIAVGGWNMASAPFTQMVATQGTRSIFINHAIEFLRKHDFDGLDLDWEYPGARGSPASDKEKFAALVRELRQAFEAEAQRSGKERLLLTAAVPAGKKNIDAGYNVPEVSKNLDFINLMSYDLHGSWEKFTGIHSALYPRKDETGDQANLNVAWAAKYWTDKGAPKEKLIIGMGTYGRSFTLATPSKNGLGDTAAQAGNAGQFTREKGFLAYYEICDMVKKGAQIFWSEEHKNPYAVLGGQWVGYDNKRSIKIKTDFIKAQGYGGGMIWAMDLDDFSGSCGEGKYPLSNVISQELGNGACHTQVVTPRPKATTTTPNWNKPWTPASTQKPWTNNPVTPRPWTNSPWTNNPVTPRPWTNKPWTNNPVTQRPWTNKPWTNNPWTNPPVTRNPGRYTGAPTHPPNHTPPTHPPHIIGENPCKGKPNGISGDPQKCTSFLLCSHGLGTRLPCAHGTIFDEELKICSWPYLVGYRCEDFYKG